jgi:hypothetical protein
MTTNETAGPAGTGPGHNRKDPMTTSDQELQALHARIAVLTGRTVEAVQAMTREEIIDATVRSSFEGFGAEVAVKHERAEGVHLMDEGPAEQAKRITAALNKFHATVPLYPVRSQDISINLFGFGRASVHFVTFDEDGDVNERYLLLSEVAEQLGVPLHRADEWARQDWNDALRSQRERDEERGELGWECLRDLVDLGLNMIVDDEQANPDAGGHRWSHAGDWLISDDRLLAFLTVSPWNREFLDNASALFGHAFKNSGLGERLKDVPAYTADGTPTGTTAYDALCDTEGLTVEEARERAMRGPSGPLAD